MNLPGLPGLGPRQEKRAAKDVGSARAVSEAPEKRLFRLFCYSNIKAKEAVK